MMSTALTLVVLPAGYLLLLRRSPTANRAVKPS